MATLLCPSAWKAPAWKVRAFKWQRKRNAELRVCAQHWGSPVQHAPGSKNARLWRLNSQLQNAIRSEQAAVRSRGGLRTLLCRNEHQAKHATGEEIPELEAVFENMQEEFNNPLALGEADGDSFLKDNNQLICCFEPKLTIFPFLNHLKYSINDP